jgi:mannose-6-phosphate isomerase-like protein (cupin superfamily)
VEQYRILFDQLQWQDALPGARFKVHRSGNKQLRLLEFTSEFIEPDWCEKGHIGFVLKGELEIDFQGRLVRYPEGSALFIPFGAASGHKARSIAAVTQLFLVEDI